MLSDITELRNFVKIVQAGSLSAAGRDLGVALSVVSKRLATLERRTETDLIARSTRQLSLTEEGQHFYEHALRILAEVDEAEAVLAAGRAEPEGVLRVSAPQAFGRAHVSVICRKLAMAHPRLSVDLVLTDRLLDLIDQRLDVVVRIGMSRDSDLMIRKLADNRRVIVASPDYLARHGAPRHPSELSAHECLSYGRSTANSWRLTSREGKVEDIRVRSRLNCDDGNIAMDWALAGFGLVLKSWVDVAEDIATGRLLRVLPEWAGDNAPISALFPRRSHMPTRLRLFLDAMADRLAATMPMLDQPLSREVGAPSRT